MQQDPFSEICILPRTRAVLWHLIKVQSPRGASHSECSGTSTLQGATANCPSQRGEAWAAPSSDRRGRNLLPFIPELDLPIRSFDPQVRARSHFEDKVQLIALKMHSWNKNCYQSGFFKF
jgi:hypothetical protein